MRFGVMLYPDQPFSELTERVRWLEDLGFDQIYLPDHSADLRDRPGTWFDSWTVLAAAAYGTERIRLGVLVANQMLRPPSQLAKQAIAVDHLSGGRFELGIGAGVFPWDDLSVGLVPLTRRERGERFADYASIVDGVLRGGFFTYAGTHLSAEDVWTVPGSAQAPRLPIVVGGQSPRMIRVASEYADIWNTHGRPGATADQVLSLTAEQNRKLDHLTSTAGRDPSSVRRSYTIFGAWDPEWSNHTYEETFERFGTVGITDFVLNWPGPHGREEFERVAREVIPQLPRD